MVRSQNFNLRTLSGTISLTIVAPVLQAVNSRPIWCHDIYAMVQLSQDNKPMTDRLYYTDSYVTEFDAHVEEIVEFDGSPALILDRTHFYPTSGGQAHDTGTLGDLQIVDVVAQDGSILHVIGAKSDDTGGLSNADVAPMVGQTVHGVIDWARRYDHMQQHSGQHLLSQVFYQLFEYETVSVHFGGLESTLDLDVETVKDEELQEAERYAARLIYANLPITARFVMDAELAQLPLRRAPTVTGRIRIVEIEKFDYSACGGTHCRHTGEVGPIKFVRQTRQNHKARLTFLCGWRALADYDQKHRLIMDAAGLYNNDYRQVPELVERSLIETKSLQKQVKELADQLLPVEAAALRAQADEVDGLSVVSHVFENRDANAIKQMAQAVVEEPNTVALLVSAAGSKLTLVVACSQDARLHAGNLLRETLTQFGGGGGGRPEFAQGGGVPVDQARNVLAFALDRIRA
jgi:alanyl-tRNA synthetase